MAAWAALPPYAGPALNTARRVEVADHVVPAVGVAIASLLGTAVAKRGARAASAIFGLGLVVVLGGLWMTLTHVPLVGQAARGEAPWGATAYHGAPGLGVVLYGLLWAKSWWADVGVHESEGVRK